jgi:hypothetical protein
MVDRRGAFAASGCDLPCKNLEILAAAPEKWVTEIRPFMKYHLYITYQTVRF